MVHFLKHINPLRLISENVGGIPLFDVLFLTLFTHTHTHDWSFSRGSYPPQSRSSLLKPKRTFSRSGRTLHRFVGMCVWCVFSSTSCYCQFFIIRKTKISSLAKQAVIYIGDRLSLLHMILILKQTWRQSCTQKPSFYTSTLIIPFSEKRTRTFCFVCSEHCLPGAVREVENPGHWLFWPCDAGEAQRNRTALRHEDPQQAEGQSRSEVRWVTVGWRGFFGLVFVFEFKTQDPAVESWGTSQFPHLICSRFLIFIQTRSCFNPSSCTLPQSSYFCSEDGSLRRENSLQRSLSLANTPHY